MNRKNFLFRSCAAITAATLPTIPSIASTDKSTNSFEMIDFAPSDLDAKLEKPITIAIIGYGGRGQLYGEYSSNYPKSVKVVGVSDIIGFRSNLAKERYKIDDKYIFGTWEDLFKVPKFADAVLVCTPDSLHYGPCMKALEMGYNVLLEKPVAQTEEQCLSILNKAKETGKIVGVCHVLRYAPYFQAIKEVIDSGEIGELVSINHFEAVEAVHMSHSFVRGNWRNSKIATPMIISKSCHDLDILRWVVGRKCTKVSAFGTLAHFKEECAPKGATKRCMDGCAVEKTCPFSAKHIYIEQGQWLHVFDNLSSDATQRKVQITDYLAKTNYGKCVYFSDNDQCDTYVLNMDFEGGVKVNFQMEGLTSYGNRHTRIQGTKGDLVGNMETFTVTDFRTRTVRKFNSTEGGGHGGGDWRLMRDFACAVSANNPKLLTSSIDASIESHLMGFAAERSRHTDKVVILNA